MNLRCNNPACNNYVNYGGRGILVCERWKTGQPYAEGFWNFVDDMGDRPPGFTLDRIDGNKNYEPENCHWASWADQNRRGKRRHRTDYSGIAGEKHGMSKLTDAERAEIRSRYNSGESVPSLVQAFPVTRAQIYRILNLGLKRTPQATHPSR